MFLFLFNNIFHIWTRPGLVLVRLLAVCTMTRATLKPRPWSVVREHSMPAYIKRSPAFEVCHRTSATNRQTNCHVFQVFQINVDMTIRVFRRNPTIKFSNTLENFMAYRAYQANLLKNVRKRRVIFFNGLMTWFKRTLARWCRWNLMWTTQVF